MLFQYRFFSWIYHSYLAEDTAGSWVLFPSLSLLSFSLSSTDFKERFLNFRSLDLDFFSLKSSGVFLSEVPPFVSRSELMPTSPVWDRCVAEMWDVRCEMWMWDVRCEIWCLIWLAYSLRSNFSALPVIWSFTNAFFVVIAFRPFSHESTFSFLTSMFRRNLTAIFQALENLRWLWTPPTFF